MDSASAHTHTLHIGIVTSHTVLPRFSHCPTPATSPPPHLSVACVVALDGERCPLLPLTLGSDHALLTLQAQQAHNIIHHHMLGRPEGAHSTTATWTGHTVSATAGRVGHAHTSPTSPLCMGKVRDFHHMQILRKAHCAV